MTSLRRLILLVLPALGCGDDTPATGDGSTSDAGTGTGTASTTATSSSTEDGTTEAATEPGSTTTGDPATGSESSGGGSTEAASTGDGSSGDASSSGGSSGSTIDCEGEVEPDGSCTTTLVAVEDAQVVSGEYSMDNFGTEEFTPFAVGLQNDFTGNQIGRAVIKFDLSTIPSDAVVATATLQVKEFDNFAGFPMTLAVKGAQSDWDEGTVTWDTQPEVARPTLDTSDVGCCGEPHELDVTSAVVAAFEAAETETTLELQSDDEATIAGVRWFMREGDGVNINGIIGVPPQLVVNWASP